MDLDDDLSCSLSSSRCLFDANIHFFYSIIQLQFFISPYWLRKSNRIYGAISNMPVVVSFVVERVFISSKAFFRVCVFVVVYHCCGTNSFFFSFVQISLCMSSGFFSKFDILSVSVSLTMRNIYIYIHMKQSWEKWVSLWLQLKGWNSGN